MITFWIDETGFEVPIVSMTRSGDFLYKYAERTIDGKLHTELIGVYFNYQLKFGIADVTVYNALWDKLTEAQSFHEIKVPDGNEYHTFWAYFSNVSDEFRKVIETGTKPRYFKNLTVNFIAQEPVNTP